MKRGIVALVACVGCGGNRAKPAEEPVSAITREQAPADPPAPEPAPAEPAVHRARAAKAALERVKGARQPPGTVTFTQDSSGTSISSDFSGLPRGRYHLVIHEGTECGPNATQAGAPWKGAESVKLTFGVGGDDAGNIDETGVQLMLDGAAPIIGQTLVLHDDKKGAPGKVLACGTIDAVGS